MSHYDNTFDRAPTISEAVREWVWVVGAERLDQQWLLSDYDTWERNPHYTGPYQPHPEGYGIYGDEHEHHHDSLERDCDEPYEPECNLVEDEYGPDDHSYDELEWLS